MGEELKGKLIVRKYVNELDAMKEEIVEQVEVKCDMKEMLAGRKEIAWRMMELGIAEARKKGIDLENSTLTMIMKEEQLPE